MKLDEDRLKHSLSVARKMVEIAKTLNLDESKQKEFFVLGFNHDIGYEYDENNEHGKIGGLMLKNSGYKYWKEVYYHGVPTSEYKSLYLDILNTADMMIDRNGNDVGFDKRLDDIKNRYGEDSIQYINCIKTINELRK